MSGWYLISRDGKKGGGKWIEQNAQNIGDREIACRIVFTSVRFMGYDSVRI